MSTQPSPSQQPPLFTPEDQEPFPEQQAAPDKPASIHNAEQTELPPALPVPLPARERLARRPWWAVAAGALLRPWLRLKIEPGEPQSLVDARPVCYVLEDYGLSNALILQRASDEVSLPSPLRPLPGDPLGRKRAYVALSRRTALSALALATGQSPSTHSESLARLIEAHEADPALDVQLVPVSIFVGRSPDKAGWFSVLFSENWALASRTRKLFSILLNGRDTLVQFAAPISVRELISEDLPPERRVRKLQRVLRAHFNRIREAIIGPDLSTKRLLIDKVLAAPSVKDAIDTQARRERPNAARADSPDKAQIKAWKQAHAYAYEIAADYSHPVVRSLSFILKPVWNRIYRGILVHHLDHLRAIAPGRSSMCPAIAAIWIICS